MAHLLFPSGKIQEIKPQNGKTFTLAELQKIIEGYIEVFSPSRLNQGSYSAWNVMNFDLNSTTVIDVNRDTWMVVNEDGKLKGCPHNELATHIYAFGSRDGVCGNALLLSFDELEGGKSN